MSAVDNGKTVICVVEKSLAERKKLCCHAAFVVNFIFMFAEII